VFPTQTALSPDIYAASPSDSSGGRHDALNVNVSQFELLLQGMVKFEGEIVLTGAPKPTDFNSMLFDKRCSEFYEMCARPLPQSSARGRTQDHEFVAREIEFSNNTVDPIFHFLSDLVG